MQRRFPPLQSEYGHRRFEFRGWSMPCVLPFPTADQSYLAVPQAAAYVGLSKSYLDKARLRGDGPRFIKRGARVFYWRADLDAWMREGRFASTSEYTIRKALAA